MKKKQFNDSEYLKYWMLMLLMLFMLAIIISGCDGLSKKTAVKSTADLEFNSSNKELTEAFKWAKNKALSYAHDNSDPVGYWVEAALPNREAFCMRDMSHQAIGAEILGLRKHNFNMFLKFAQNISKEKDYCTYWEINRYNKPAPVDYENDHDFWYNLPANFDLTYNAYRVYKWTGNKDYLDNSDLKNFYELSLNEYVDHWDLGADKILNRSRTLHLGADSEKSRFGNKRGIPTYNEGGRGETLLGIDMSASMIAAYKAYSEMLRLNGAMQESEKYGKQALREQEFLDDFWWDAEKQEYRSILYDDGTYDYFMVGDNQAFLHYLYYFDTISDNQKLMEIVNKYEANFDKLIVELKSYLPIIFYENGRSEMANKMLIDLCSAANQRRDYPENSFTVVEHLTRGLMGIDVDAVSNTFSTISRVTNDGAWAEMKNIPLLANKVTVVHYGQSKTKVTNESGGTLNWSAKVPGIHSFLFINGHRTDTTSVVDGTQTYSVVSMELNEGDEAIVSVDK